MTNPTHPVSKATEITENDEVSLDALEKCDKSEFEPKCTFESLNDSLRIHSRRSEKTLLSKESSKQSLVSLVASFLDDINKHVAFSDTVNVRWYETILSDNPTPTVGPPVGIGWKFSVSDIQINDSNVNPESESLEAEEKKKTNLYLTPVERVARLHDFEYTDEEMLRVINEIQKVQRFREKAATSTTNMTSSGKFVVTAKPKQNNSNSINKTTYSSFGTRRRPLLGNRRARLGNGRKTMSNTNTNISTSDDKKPSSSSSVQSDASLNGSITTGAVTNDEAQSSSAKITPFFNKLWKQRRQVRRTHHRKHTT